MAGKTSKELRNPSDLSYLMDPSFAEMADPIVEKTDTKDVETLPISELHSFNNHPFKVNTTCPDFLDLVESIREHGILYPIIVRPSRNGYEVIAGHRRLEAAKIVGLKEVPVIIRVLNDYEATVVMVHTNIAREEISHGEKAKAYRMCHDAGKHQGIAGVDTAAEIGKERNDSKRQVYRYIRLSYLSNDLLSLVDSGKLAFNTGVQLAYLKEDTQHNLMVFIEQYKVYPSIDQANMLKKEEEDIKESLSYEKIVSMLVEPPKSKPATKLSFKTKDIASYFEAGTSAETMSNTILMLLEKYHNGEFDDVISQN